LKIEKELGGYSRWQTREYFSFVVGSAGAVGAIRDGNSELVVSVVKQSTAGEYVVTLRTNRPTIKRHVLARVSLGNPAAGTPTTPCIAYFVDGSYSQHAQTFTIQTINTTTGAAANADSGSRYSVELVGSISGVGTDAA